VPAMTPATNEPWPSPSSNVGSCVQLDRSLRRRQQYEKATQQAQRGKMEGGCRLLSGVLQAGEVSKRLAAGPGLAHHRTQPLTQCASHPGGPP
jgi:hypothetical protein